MLGSAPHNNGDMRIPKFRIFQTRLKLRLSSFISIANENNAGYSVLHHISSLEPLEVQNVRVNTKQKMSRSCDLTFETKVIIVCESFFRKPWFTFFHCCNQPFTKSVGTGCVR